MQGPFTNQHVGGNRHRHTDLNEGSDTELNRAEAWFHSPPTSDFYPAKAAFGTSINADRPGSTPTTAETKQPSAPLTSKTSNTEQVPLARLRWATILQVMKSSAPQAEQQTMLRL